MDEAVKKTIELNKQPIQHVFIAMTEANVLIDVSFLSFKFLFFSRKIDLQNSLVSFIFCHGNVHCDKTLKFITTEKE